MAQHACKLSELFARVGNEILLHSDIKHPYHFTQVHKRENEIGCIPIQPDARHHQMCAAVISIVTQYYLKDLDISELLADSSDRIKICAPWHRMAAQVPWRRLSLIGLARNTIHRGQKNKIKSSTGFAASSPSAATGAARQPVAIQYIGFLACRP